MKMKLELHVKAEGCEPIELTLEEAEALYKELGQIFDRSKKNA